MIRPKSLQQRLMLFLLLPVAALLLCMGIAGFFYARYSLLAQWEEAAILKLQRAAHDVDMRLSRPKEWLEMFDKSGGEHFDEHTQEWILDQLRQLQGVDRVTLTRVDDNQGGSMSDLHRKHHEGDGARKHMMEGGEGMMRFNRASGFWVSNCNLSMDTVLKKGIFQTSSTIGPLISK